MKIFKNIFARIWAFWGLSSFVITFLIIFIPSMFSWLMPERMGQNWFILVSRRWMDVWLLLVGCPVKINGREHFKKDVAYIVTCNHNSMLDIPLSSPFIPGGNKTIAKNTFKKVPIFGFFYMRGGILIDRKSDASRKSGFIRMKNVLKKGIHMCIYPEGTRNRTKEPLKKFHDGAFRLAIETGNEIIPAVIFNTSKALPVTKTFYFLPTRLRMDFLPPISPIGKTVDELREEVFGVMARHYLSGNR